VRNFYFRRNFVLKVSPRIDPENSC
jgi:hypothetical protein